MEDPAFRTYENVGNFSNMASAYSDFNLIRDYNAKISDYSVDILNLLQRQVEAEIVTRQALDGKHTKQITYAIENIENHDHEIVDVRLSITFVKKHIHEMEMDLKSK